MRPVPRSLVNIYRELETDLGLPTPSTGDLTPWADQGVLLLNRVLTVSPGQAGQPPRAGLGARDGPRHRRPSSSAAGRWSPSCGAATRAAWCRTCPGVACIESPHPSPLSAHAGFFGSRPFSRANELLVGQGADPVDWRIP